MRSLHSAALRYAEGLQGARHESCSPSIRGLLLLQPPANCLQILPHHCRRFSDIRLHEPYDSTNTSCSMRMISSKNSHHFFGGLLKEATALPATIPRVIIKLLQAIGPKSLQLISGRFVSVQLAPNTLSPSWHSLRPSNDSRAYRPLSATRAAAVPRRSLFC